MKRKLFSAMLSIFALLLLMGAAAVPEQPAALLAEEESAESQALETEAKSPNANSTESLVSVGGAPMDGGNAAPDGLDSPEDPAGPAEPDDLEKPGELEEPETPAEPVVQLDSGLLIDGQPAPLELNRRAENGTTYVSLSVMAKLLEPAAQVTWDGAAMTVTTPKLSLTAQAGELYMVANGRYLYVQETVQNLGGGQVSVPLRTVAKAFGATVGYNGATGVVTVARGSGTIASGDSFYNQDDLFWLSRVIHRESGNQPTKGKMAVGNVVLNRVSNPAFPNSIEGVLAQKNQFSSYATGAMAKTKPSQASTIAAKLVLDGGEVEETKGALFFDSSRNSWASRNKTYVATIGNHKFYR